MAGNVEDPARFVPLAAMAFGSEGLAATPVDAEHPLPVTHRRGAAGSTPLAGSTSASGVLGPFLPDPDVPIWLSLSGTWTGSAQLLRSTDGGTTKLPLTIAGQAWATFAANANEAVAQESSAAASYWLAVTIASGTLAYRVSQ